MFEHFTTALRVTLLIGLAGLGLKVAVPPAAADVLAHVPDKAALAVVVPNVAALDDAIERLGRAIDVDFLNQARPDLAIDELLKTLFGAADGLAMDGPLVVAAVPSDEPSPVLLCGLRDAAAWRTVAGASEQDGKLTLRAGGQDWLVAVEGDVLILARRADDLNAARSAHGEFARVLAERTRGLGDGQQVLFFADVPAWGDMLERGMAMLDGIAQMGLMMSGGSQAPRSVELWKWAFQELRGLAEQTQTVAAAARIGDDDVRLVSRVALRAGAPAADYLKAIRPTERDPLRGLVSGPFVATFGCDWETPQGKTSLCEKALEIMLKASANEAPADAPQRDQAVQAAVAAYRAMSGYNVTVSAIPGGDGLLFSGSYFSRDPRSMLQSVTAMLEANSELVGGLGAGVTTRARIGRETIAGMDVTVAGLTLESADPAATQAIQFVYGASPVFLIAVRQDQVVYAFGPDAAARRRMEQFLAGGYSELAAHSRVREALARLSKSPQLLTLIDLGELANLGVRILRSSGTPIPALQVQAAHAPLIGLAWYFEPDAVRGELAVPIAALRQTLRSLRPGGLADEAQ